jgi:aerobic C4-dicarboxylate transport protein
LHGIVSLSFREAPRLNPRVITAPTEHVRVVPQKGGSVLRHLYVQVLIGVVAGALIGHFFPGAGKSLQPLGDGFVKLIKMLIAPVIFCTVVHGIASLEDMRKLGRVGLKALIYFEAVSTLALLIGLAVVNLLQPGSGLHVNPSELDPKTTSRYSEGAHALSTAQFILNIIPKTFFDAFATGDLLQVLLISALTAGAISLLDPATKAPILRAIEHAGKVFFGVMRIVIHLAPLGALGAMAFTVGSYGLASINSLLYLMAGFYLTAILFVVVVLGLIARATGFSIFRFLYYIRDELLLVLGTSSSETALPSMIQKMRRLGCAPSTVGLVIPTGYSFNLDGTNIYMSMAAIFLAQATDTRMTLQQQFGLLLVAMITSKGSSGVTGAGFITLAATLSAVPSVPIQSLALLVGIDRFMSECRALTNIIGNGVATVVVSRWEGELSAATLLQNLKDAECQSPPFRLPVNHHDGKLPS